MSAYKLGGVGCSGKCVMHQPDGKTEIPVPLYARSGARTRVAKNTMYCSEDFFDATGSPMTRSDVHSAWPFARILPANFLAHNHFKIVIVGSKRAGKTTFISRMFDITGTRPNVEMAGRMMVNAMAHKGFSLLPYAPRDLSVSDDEETPWTVSDNAWFKNEEKNITFFSDYSIDIAQGRYPTATDRVKEGAEDQTRNPMRFPFIFEVGQSDYIYFYDIAGEDAERSGNRLAKMMVGAPTGIFYLVDGNSNEAGNTSVHTRIQEVMRKNGLSCPIAVILTKFDKIESAFDPNCHCLRSDVYDMMGRRYEGSLLEENIELASEEIQAYLEEKRICPKFGAGANVRYFGVSSFADSRSVHHEEQTEGARAQAEVNYLRYASSAKRMELPLIWMLRQFGCIV